MYTLIMPSKQNDLLVPSANTFYSPIEAGDCIDITAFYKVGYEWEPMVGRTAIWKHHTVTAQVTGNPVKLNNFIIKTINASPIKLPAGSRVEYYQLEYNVPRNFKVLVTFSTGFHRNPRLVQLSEVQLQLLFLSKELFPVPTVDWLHKELIEALKKTRWVGTREDYRDLIDAIAKREIRPKFHVDYGWANMEYYPQCTSGEYNEK